MARLKAISALQSRKLPNYLLAFSLYLPATTYYSSGTSDHLLTANTGGLPGVGRRIPAFCSRLSASLGDIAQLVRPRMAQRRAWSPPRHCDDNIGTEGLPVLEGLVYFAWFTLFAFLGKTLIVGGRHQSQDRAILEFAQTQPSLSPCRKSCY
jgi:hypothetical protein